MPSLPLKRQADIILTFPVAHLWRKAECSLYHITVFTHKVITNTRVYFKKCLSLHKYVVYQNDGSGGFRSPKWDRRHYGHDVQCIPCSENIPTVKLFLHRGRISTIAQKGSTIYRGSTVSEHFLQCTCTSL